MGNDFAFWHNQFMRKIQLPPISHHELEENSRNDDELGFVPDSGWGTKDGIPFCFCCGCQLCESLDKLKGRKFCGVCHSSLRNTPT
jgi:hypothetical protein